MTLAVGVPPDIKNYGGPLVLAIILSSLLYGALVLQVYAYYLAFPNDRRLIKSLVYTTFLLNTAQTMMLLRDAFTIFGVGFGDMDSLTGLHLKPVAVPLITGLVSVLVQSFYSYQIRVISRSWVLLSIVLLVAVAQFIGSIIQTVDATQATDTGALQRKTRISCTIWLFGSALCDTIIAVAMTFYLLRASYSLKSNLIIRRLVRLVIETGSLTAAAAILVAVLFITVHYPYYEIPAECLAKLYAGALMVILNSRIRIQGGRDGAESPTVIYSDWIKSGPLTFRQNGSTMNGGSQGGVASLAEAGELAPQSCTSHYLEADAQIPVPLRILDIGKQDYSDSPSNLGLAQKLSRSSL